VILMHIRLLKDSLDIIVMFAYRLTFEDLFDCVVYRGEDLLVGENSCWSSLHNKNITQIGLLWTLY
jgi:hypothetical protein